MADSYVRGTKPAETDRDQLAAELATPHPAFAASPARRRLKGAYLCWLYRTKAWNVSFDEWQTDRARAVELLTA